MVLAALDVRGSSMSRERLKTLKVICFGGHTFTEESTFGESLSVCKHPEGPPARVPEGGVSTVWNRYRARVRMLYRAQRAL